MTGGARLRLDLDVLRRTLGAYLEQLRSQWGEPHGGEAGEVARLVAAAGAQARPDRASIGEVKRLLAAAGRRQDELGSLVSTLGLSPGEELLVAAAWWADADPQLAVLLGVAHDDGTRRYASAGLLHLALEPFGVAAPASIDDQGTLVAAGVLEPQAGAAGPLRLTATARTLLDGGALAPAPAGAPVPARLAGFVDALARHLDAPAAGVVLLRGSSGVGGRAVVLEAVARAGLVAVGGERPDRELKLLARLRRAVPVVAAGDVEALDWTAGDGPLVAWGEQNAQVPGAYVVELPAPTHAERTVRWAGVLERFGLERAGELAEVLAARFAFTDGDIDAVAERVALDAAWKGGSVDRALVWDAARRQPEHALERIAALVTPAFSLDDLVLTEEAAAKLRELVAHVALQHVVLDEWGFRRRLPRGQGVAALFTGPPGTGKTTATEAVARELGQDLYRIDLSAVVSKYVGETEKNLASAFDEAERGSAVLFFDEADALFGKRTEVRDAHDRYANLEVNYLLQRVETFTGLVVLASNRAASIDDAFLRRLRFVIRFEAPDAELRERLWRRSFPPEARLAELDWDALASAELAGGNIQSAALAAAYLAAADGGTITGEHVEHALLREHQKLGKAWAPITGGRT